MNSFQHIIDNYNWDEVSEQIYLKNEEDVVCALAKPKKDLEDFKALISPAAEPYLEQMAEYSHELTQRRFGKTIQLYIPLYVSNECQNICTYCGFSLDIDIPRKTLSDKELLAEVKQIKKMGYDHVLLVSGEANKSVGVDYFEHAIRLIRPYFSNIAIEVQPLEVVDYQRLIHQGLHTVLVYQETYRRETYKTHHPKGKKSNYDYRLATPERLGEASIYKMGLGVLIGLEDWRTDSFFTALHLSYLERRFWQTRYSISFPRLRPCAGADQIKSVITDRQLVQLICAYRLLNEEVELSMSTRESPKFRDHIIKLGITSTSAGSETNPGGYNQPKSQLEQFEVDDKRSLDEVTNAIREQGYEPVFKDWDKMW